MNPNLLKLLFSTFPPVPSDDFETQLAAYAVALEGHSEGDIETAVRKLIRGEVAGHNPAFAPSASMLGAAVRQCMNDRLDSEHRENLRRPALPPPDIVKSPEAQARVAALAKAQIDKLAGTMRTDEAVAHKARLKRTNEYFDAQRGYAVGDPVQDENAA